MDHMLKWTYEAHIIKFAENSFEFFFPSNFDEAVK